ncbi:TIGR00270 family protein [Candidatus Micrarchaeota archaeon]|nr:TIGR00270 family protein [Candidatus Micrarchaeota archaeon]
MDCEICGRGESVAIILIEGAKMNTCRNCSSHGKIIYNLRDEPKKEKPISSKTQEVEDIVENYAKLIHSKREGMGLPIPVVAERINEKESYLENIERGHMKPTLEVAHKLEKELGVKLIEKLVEEVGPTAAVSASKGITLADFVVTEKKRSK